MPSSAPLSRTSTPNPNPSSRFTSQTSTAEDLLKSQTVGLVHLSDFRKRRAEALEQKEREAEDRSLGRFAPGGTPGTATPASDRYVGIFGLQRGIYAHVYGAKRKSVVHRRLKRPQERRRRSQMLSEESCRLV